VTLSRPATWPLPLAAFLLRGGIVALAVPLLVLPTPSGIADVLYAPLRDLYLGQPSTELVLTIAVLIVAGAGLFLAAAVAAAWFETRHVALAAADEEIGSARARTRTGWSVGTRATFVRLLAHLPLGVALAWGLTALVEATYAELVLPSDPRQALALRVLAATPGPLFAVLVAWLLGEVAGGLGVRRVVLHGEGVFTALGGAWWGLVSKPRTALGTMLVTDVALVVGLVPAIIATALAADRVRLSVGVRGEGWELTVVLMLFVGLWILTLVLAGLLTAFRSVAWTFEALRRAEPGTVGGVEAAGHDRDDRADWTPLDARSTL
jgi:hypothetical protein